MEYPVLVAGGRAPLRRAPDSPQRFLRARRAGRPRVEFTPDGRRVTGHPGRTRNRSRPGIVPRRGHTPGGRHATDGPLALDAPGLVDRHDLGEVTIFADEAKAVADAREGHRTIPQPSRTSRNSSGRTRSRRTLVRDVEVRASVRAPATMHPLPGGEAIVAAPASGRFTADGAPVDRRSREDRPAARASRAASRGRDRSSDARGRSHRSPSRDSKARESSRPGPSGCSPTRAVPARRVEDARRATVVAEARLTSGRSATRAARRNPAHGRRGRGRERVRAARADQRPPRGSDGHAGRGVRRRRTALQDRADRSSGTGGAGAGRGRDPGAPGHRCRTRDTRSPAGVDPRRSPRARLRRDRCRRPGRCRCRWKSTIPESACWSVSPVPPCSTRESGAGCQRCRARRC